MGNYIPVGTVLEDEFKIGGNDRENEKKKLKNDIAIIDERIKTAVLKNLDGVLDDTLFRQTRTH